MGRWLALSCMLLSGCHWQWSSSANDVVFVIDGSSSMRGQAFERSRRRVLDAIDDLPDGTPTNVVLFDYADARGRMGVFGFAPGFMTLSPNMRRWLRAFVTSLQPGRLPATTNWGQITMEGRYLDEHMHGSLAGRIVVLTDGIHHDGGASDRFERELSRAVSCGASVELHLESSRRRASLGLLEPYVGATASRRSPREF